MSSKIRELVEKYGSISTVTFVIFNKIGTRDNTIINHALKDLLGLKTSIQQIEKLSKKQGSVFDLGEGTCIQWIFPKINGGRIEEIIDLISEGLSHLKKDFRFLYYTNNIKCYKK